MQDLHNYNLINYKQLHKDRAKSARSLCRGVGANEVENMPKIKKKLTSAQNRERKRAQAESHNKYIWMFMYGKQVSVKRPPTIEGINAEEYIQQNVGPIWLHQNEMWAYIQANEDEALS